MDIRINGEKADITLEKEKTVGEILAGLDNWLGAADTVSGNYYRLSGLVIDGETIDSQSLEASFGRDLSTINSLDISVSNLHELVHAALGETQRAVKAWGELDFSEKQGFAENWKTSPSAALLREQYPELCIMVQQTLAGEGFWEQILSTIISERLRELEKPGAEIEGMEQLIDDIAARLENLPLDIQTGKDKRASETIQLFTAIAEKIFRIYKILKARGYNFDGIKKDFLNEFSGILKEMLAAYEQKDAVLLGDMSEYEMAPRLRAFYAGLKNPASGSAG